MADTGESPPLRTRHSLISETCGFTQRETLTRKNAPRTSDNTAAGVHVFALPQRAAHRHVPTSRHTIISCCCSSRRRHTRHTNTIARALMRPPVK